ncbi:hypothetical protein Ntsu_45520 [Nocardia sp. IFM 10818]
MTLTRKGSRRITVDGVVYRWRVRGRPTYDQGNCWSPCTYAVELAEGGGAVLVVKTDRPHPSNWAGRAAEPVLPGEVAETIRVALERGWVPSGKGTGFRLDMSRGFEAGFGA